MQPPRPASLSQALQHAEGRPGRVLAGRDHAVALEALRVQTCLEREAAFCAGCSVLLATEDQFLAAMALCELDGVARRIVLCPPDLKAEDRTTIMQRAAVDCIVSDGDPSAFPPESGARFVRCAWPPLPRSPTRLEDMATEWLLLTSGTTGVPKMVRYDFAALTAAIRPWTGAPPVWATFYDMRRYGGLQIFLRGLLGTGSLVLSAAGEPVPDFLHRLGRHCVTHLSGTPSHWRRALMSPAIAAIAPRYVRLSGEIADQAILDALHQAFPVAKVGHAYASTEAGVGFEVDDGREGFPVALLGRSAAGVEIKVEDGSLRIRSGRTASGYLGSGELALADAEGFIDTGDMVEERAGRLFFVGRRGGIINVGGLKVHPEEVEAVINRHASVRMSRVEGRKNPITGSIVVAAVVLREGDDEEAAAATLKAEILAVCRASLPPHKVPAVLRFVPTLAVTPAGKLVRAHA